MKKLFINFFIVFVGIVIIHFYFTKSVNKTKLVSTTDLQVGDLLFQDLDCGKLCDAIETVTKGKENITLSHVAIVSKVDKDIFVVEAIPPKVKSTKLRDFISRSPKIFVGRLKKQFRQYIPIAVNKLDNFLGKKYDDLFLIDNSKYYCSELIYEVFKPAKIFTLKPMTFKAPDSTIFMPAWVDYFKKLNKAIPEQKPGINPADMYRSDKVEILGKLKLSNHQQ